MILNLTLKLKTKQQYRYTQLCKIRCLYWTGKLQHVLRNGCVVLPVMYVIYGTYEEWDWSQTQREERNKDIFIMWQSEMSNSGFGGNKELTGTIKRTMDQITVITQEIWDIIIDRRELSCFGYDSKLKQGCMSSNNRQRKCVPAMNHTQRLGFKGDIWSRKSTAILGKMWGLTSTKSIELSWMFVTRVDLELSQPFNQASGGRRGSSILHINSTKSLWAKC